MKTLLLTCLLALGCHATLHAQLPGAPPALRSGYNQPSAPKPQDAPQAPAAAKDAAMPSTTQEIDKLAEEAQKALFKSVDKGTTEADKTTTSRTTTGPLHLTAPKLEDPTLWSKDSVHKLAVMDVVVGGSQETVMFELYPNDAPQTVNNFIDRCDSGFYNGLAFHRAIQGFLVQTGDPLTADESARLKWGTGGEDKTIPAEIKLPHRVGAVAMARRSDKVNPERRSNGSQFYFALGKFAALDGNYTVFGQVISGYETIKRISMIPVDANDCPVARIEIKSIKVINQKGPMSIPAMSAGEGMRYIKPDAARGLIGRFFRHVW